MNLISAEVFVGDSNQNLIGVFRIPYVFAILVFSVQGGITVRKGILANLCTVAENRDVGKSGAMAERLSPNGRDTIWDRNASQPVAIKECPSADGRNFVRNCNVSQAGARIECGKSNGRKVIGKCNVGQISTGIKRRISND